jgi:hypothetical protein
VADFVSGRDAWFSTSFRAAMRYGNAFGTQAEKSGYNPFKFWLDSATGRTHVFPSHHGQPEKETSSEDEQAQAPEALEVEPAQEAHVAEISRALPAILPFKARRACGGLLFLAR